MADVAREARASIAALVEAYRARPTTIYVRIVLLASTIFYDWLLFGKQLRPTKDLFIADSEKFVNRWKNMAFSFQIIVAFIPLLGVGTVTPFLVSQRETSNSGRWSLLMRAMSVFSSVALLHFNFTSNALKTPWVQRPIQRPPLRAPS